MITLIEIPTVGRYVWWPSLSIVGFIQYGHRKASRELHLETRTDSWAGALRTAARDLIRHSETVNAHPIATAGDQRA
jgi:hypothetical protein